MNDQRIDEIKTRYGESAITKRFKLTGELRCPKAGEWYWWTGKYGPAACRTDVDRPFNAPILVESTEPVVPLDVLKDQLRTALKSRETWKLFATRTDASEDDTTEPDRALKDWGLI